MTQRTAAILAADVVGYTRLIAEAEEQTLHVLTDLQSMLRETIARFDGRAFNTAGDAIRAEFASTLNAVEAAVALQQTLQARNAGAPLARQMLYRIGIADGDVIDQDGDVHGTPVTLATALEGLAPPGGLCITKHVYDQISDVHGARFTDLGVVKAAAAPSGIHAFTMVMTQGVRGATDAVPDKTAIQAAARRSPFAWAGAAAGLLAVAGLAWWMTPIWLTQSTTTVVSAPTASPVRPASGSTEGPTVASSGAGVKPANPSVAPPAPVSSAPKPSPIVPVATTAPPATAITPMSDAPLSSSGPNTDWPALEALRKRHVAQCSGDDVNVAITSCRALLKAGQLPDASLAEIQASLGSALRQTGQISEAIDALTAAVKLVPTSATYNNRGLAYFESGKMDLAIEDFGAAIKLKPTDGEALNNRAWTQFKAGRLNLAAQDAKLATAYAGGSAYVWDTSGHINEALGNKPVAIEHFRRAIELDPKQEASRKGLARLQAKP